MKKTGKVRNTSPRVAKGLIRLGDAEWYKEEPVKVPPKEKPVKVPSKKPVKSMSPSYNTRQIRPRDKNFRNKVI